MTKERFKKLGKIMTVAVLCIAAVALTACGGVIVPFSENKSITVVGREAGSGTRGAFLDVLNNYTAYDNDNKVTQRYNDTAAVINTVKQNGNAIGYDSLAYINSNVKTIKVDGVEATAAAINSGDYKLQRPLRIIYKEDVINASAALKDFLTFLKSSQAKTVIEDEGYVAGEGDTSVYVKPSNLPATGTINVSGSTSLKPLMDVLVKKYKELSGITVVVSGGGSSQGRTDTTADTSHFGMISNMDVYPSDGLVDYTVARDGIAIIVNKENPITNITTDALRDIYIATGAAISEKTVNGNVLAADTVKAKPATWAELINTLSA